MADGTRSRLDDGAFRLWLAVAAVAGFTLRVTYVLFKGSDRADQLGIDAPYYHDAANLLADGRGFVSPALLFTAQPGADHPPAYQVLLAGPSWVGLDTVRAHQLVSCVLGAATIVLVGVLGREIAGSRVGLLAAAMAAVSPNFWSHDAAVMSESLVLLVVTLVVWLAYRSLRQLTLAHAIGLGAATGLAVLTRAEAILFVPLLVVPVILLARSTDRRRRVGLVVVALGSAVVVVAPWALYNLSRFERPTLISTGLGQTLLAANCHDSYFGRDVGYWSLDCLLETEVPGGDPSTHDEFYRDRAREFAGDHPGRVPVVAFARLGRTWGFYAPFDQLDVDRHFNHRELTVGVVGLLVLYTQVAASVVGVVVLRRRRVPAWPLLAPVVMVAIAVVLTYGQTRFRAPAEVSLTVLSAVAVDLALRRLRGRAAISVSGSGSTRRPL